MCFGSPNPMRRKRAADLWVEQRATGPLLGFQAQQLYMLDIPPAQLFADFRGLDARGLPKFRVKCGRREVAA